MVTTHNSLYSLLGILTQYPNVQKKLQEEVDTILGGSLPSIAIKYDMPYTRAVSIPGGKLLTHKVT